MIEIAASAALIAGTFFIAVAAVGLGRMPDVYGRSHAVTKASTLGIAGVLLGSMITFGVPGAEIVAMVFVILTNPVGGHMIARSAYLNGIPMSDSTVMDEMRRAGEQQDVTHDTA